ncbi:hypothetical protein GCM10017600_53850 [Streptosporangium carneum]|uniref:Protein kinase domain-containing protein n=2 Tax=Streptosporangium carneum TaxID=47481 RepID=A0A9W6I5B9_9ACTN|nr:hypothetical protein GCM10017600_53850 [Streptosporangium carneum]
MPQIAPLEAGEPRQLGQFRIVGRIGEGGQGIVYLGENTEGKRAAIKLLHVKFSGDAIARSRFAREARAAQRVASFCTAGVVDVDLEGDTPYIASEYIEGRSLREVVEAEGPLRGEALQRLAIGTATALTAIHQAAIVHRDFKPDNVLIAADGPRVVDFGIARILDSTGTITSRAIGTPAYMAPEQISGADVGPHTDVFAWGATMAFAATGETVFEGGSIAVVLNRILNHDVDVDVMPEPLRGVVRSALSKAQGERPSADQILLRLLGHPESVSASPAVLNQGAQIAGPDDATSPIRMPGALSGPPARTDPSPPPPPFTEGRAQRPGYGERASSPGGVQRPSSPADDRQGPAQGHAEHASPGHVSDRVGRFPLGGVEPPALTEPSSQGHAPPRSRPPAYGERAQPPAYGEHVSSPAYREHPSVPVHGEHVPSQFHSPRQPDVPPPSWQSTLPGQAAEPSPPGRSHRGRWIAAAVAVLLVVGAGAAVYFTGWRPTIGAETKVSPTPTPPPASSSPGAFSSIVDKAAATHKLTIGLRDFLPGVALNDGGTWKGFEVDLATEIAKKLGVPASGVTFRATSRQERPRLLASGDLDLVVSTYSINRTDDVTFAGPYYVAHVDVLVKSGSSIASLADLEGKRICQPLGSSSVAVLQARVGSLDLVPADNYTQCMDLILAGKVDAVPGDDLVLAGYADRAPIRYKVVGLKVTDERYAVAVKKGDSRACKAVQGAIVGLYRDGTVTRLLDRHFSKVDFPTREDNPPIMAGCG